MTRAAWLAVENRGSGRRMQGASTITQQVARNIFLNNSYSFARKLREMVLALALERKFSKEQILELYLNKVYFWGGAYGVDAASRKRSEERRGGKECGSTGSYRWSPCH